MKDELTDDDKKQWAKHLYTREGETIKDISLIVNASEAQVRNWATTGAWDGMKRSLLISREVQLEQMYSLLEKLTTKMMETEDVNPKDADLAIKYTAAIKNLDVDITVAQIVEVAKLFTHWLRKRDLSYAKAVTLEFDAFIKHRLTPGP